MASHLNHDSLTQALDFLADWLAYHAAVDDVPGFTVAIYHHDGLIFSRAYGYDDVLAGTPLSTVHRFNIGSQTKMFTAVLLQVLAQQSQLRLAQPVIDYLPWLSAHPDPAWRKISLQQLLWHGAGLVRDGTADYWQLQAPFPNAADLRRTILTTPLVAPRGRRLKYSNVGYALLGQVIEAATGQSYAQALQSFILSPLGLHCTSLQAKLPGYPLALGYSRPLSKTSQRRAFHRLDIDTQAWGSATGLYATAEDLCRFLAAQLPGRHQLLSAASQHQLHQNGRQHWAPPAERGTPYGLGFTAFPTADGTLIGHAGSFVGHNSCTMMHPEHELVVAVMASAKDAPAAIMAEGIMGVLHYFRRFASRPLTASRAQLNLRLVNLFTTLQLTATAERIVAVYPDDWAPFESIVEELEVVGPDTLQIVEASDLDAVGESLQLSRDAQSRIVAVNHAGVSAWPEAFYPGPN